MKKLLIILFFLLTLSSFSQAPMYSYVIKLQGVTDSTSAADVAELMKDVFRVDVFYNVKTGLFEFETSMSINGTGFEYHMKDEGYYVTIFEKKEIKTETK